MPLTPGTTLGSYSVIAKIGEGGMGEVYRARDTKLDRDVALKVLPPAFTDDPDRLARFEREAKVLASLNHTNIGHIYGLEEAERTKALVLELVEGPTLADRIKQGPIPVDEALPIAKQIAEALEAAHEQGVIHRDLKPANIKLRPDGTVKVLDFGLAKALDTAPEGDPSQSPTLTAAATQMGVIMGTAAYMSPEQARGKPVDRRADIWAFGVVVYEMLTGARPFQGEDVSLTLASVMKSDVDVKTLPPDLPETLRTVLRRCLEKDPLQRFRDMGDVRLAMEGAFETTVTAPSGPVVVPPQLRVWQRPLIAVVTVLTALVIGWLAHWTTMRPNVVPAGLVRFTIVPAELGLSRNPGQTLTISPDGTQVVYSARNEGGSAPQIYLRPIDEVESAPVRGSEGGRFPFVSPDGEWIGFVDSQGSQTLKKVSIFGGLPVTVTESPTPIWGASWGTDDQIVFGSSPDREAGLYRVSGSGGEPEALTTVDAERGERMHAWPSLIDGRAAVLFVIAEGNQNPLADGQLAVLDLANGEVTRLGLAGVSPRYVSTGHLVYAGQDGSVRAVPFETASLTVTGSPVPVIEGVSVELTGAANFSISADGRLVYAVDARRSTAPERSLVWVDRDGREEAIGAEPRDYIGVRVSPNGERVAVVVRDDANEDVLVYDVARDIPTRLTFSPARDSFPVWSPDGEQIVFSSGRDNSMNLFGKAADGTGQPVRVAASDQTQYASTWSPDGESLIYTERNPATGFDILRRPVDADPASESEILVQTEFDESRADLSPDGRWLAYASNESGQTEVYVRPYPNVADGRWQISRGGGNQPEWAPDGRELFYWRASTVDDASVMAVPIDTTSSFVPGRPEVLFSAQTYLFGPGPRQYDVAPDGRFLVITGGEATIESAPLSQIQVVLNWFEELKRLVPTDQ